MNQTPNNHDRPISNHSHGLFNNIYMRKEKNVPYSLLVSHEFSQGSYYPVPNEKLGWVEFVKPSFLPLYYKTEICSEAGFSKQKPPTDKSK